MTGFGGHDVAHRLRAFEPEVLLVLGTRLGEMSSFWDERLIPAGGLIHVDVDEEAFGRGFPQSLTQPVMADIRGFCTALLPHLPQRRVRPPAPAAPQPRSAVAGGRVRPSRLMEALQRVVVDGSDAAILTEAGNCFARSCSRRRATSSGPRG